MCACPGRLDQSSARPPAQANTLLQVEKNSPHFASTMASTAPASAIAVGATVVVGTGKSGVVKFVGETEVCLGSLIAVCAVQLNFLCVAYTFIFLISLPVVSGSEWT